MVMTPAYLSGQFLLASPAMYDPNLERACIAVCAHDPDGALGVGIGAVVEGLRLHDLLRQLDIEPGDCPDAPIHQGGPVEPRRGFVIHSNDWAGQDTIDVAGRWSLTGTLDVLRAIAEGRGPARWLVALGYAGWDAGQLDAELAGPGWVHVPGDAGILFDTTAEDRWQRAFAGAGIDPQRLSSLAGTA